MLRDPRVHSTVTGFTVHKQGTDMPSFIIEAELSLSII